MLLSTGTDIASSPARRSRRGPSSEEAQASTDITRRRKDYVRVPSLWNIHFASQRDFASCQAQDEHEEERQVRLPGENHCVRDGFGRNEGRLPLEAHGPRCVVSILRSETGD